MELRSRRQAPAAPDTGMNGIWMDISRAAEELGYAPSYSVDDAIAEYVAWMREHAE
jgi:nucleoside-diphosphate-sugar epimerase